MPVVHYVVRPGEPVPYANPGLCYQQGTGEVLSDDSDLTFIRSDTTTRFNPIGMWVAPIPAVPDSILDKPDLGMSITFRASIDISDGSAREIFLNPGTMADGPGGTGVSDLIFTGPPQDQVADSPWLASDTTLRDGTACIFFAATDASPFESATTATLYEFSLILSYESSGAPAIRRIYPRPQHRVYPVAPFADRRTGSAAIL